jgi:hypothetical protein
MDPLLLIFVAGSLVGISFVLLARLVPDVISIVRHLMNRRRVPRGRDPFMPR